MRRFMLLAALCAALVLAMATAAFGQTRGPSGADGTYNCEDFDDQGQAQEFSLGDPGDTNGLDEDGDGRVCESLPTAAPGGNNNTVLIPGQGESPTGMQYAQPTPSQLEAAQNFAAGGPVSCEGFGSVFGAQQFYDFNATPEEQAILDPDGNGFACDTPTATQSAQPTTPVTTTRSRLPAAPRWRCSREHC